MSWIRVEPHTSGLGPDTQQGNVLCHEVLVWNQFDDPMTGGDINVNRIFRFAAKRATTSGIVPGVGFKPTPWYRGVMKVTSERPYSYFVPQASNKHWYRKNWGDSSLAQAVPNTVIPEWDRLLGNLNVGSDLVNQAKTKCMESIAQSKFDASEALAGAVQTAEMLARVIQVLILTIVDLRKGRVARAAKRLDVLTPKNPKDVADAWLQMQYGWRPLVSDAYAAVELLKSQLASGELLMKATGTQTAPLPDWRCFGNPPATSKIPFNVQNENSKVSARAECVYRISDPYAKAWAAVNFGNPLYLAWVATPFSFLVDWLIPVGDWLLGMSQANGCEFVSSWVTQRLQIKAWGTGPNVGVTGSQYGLSKFHMNFLPRTRYEVMVIQRDVLVTWPRPELYINRSPFRSPTRLANALALATSMSYGSRRKTRASTGRKSRSPN